MSQQTVLNGVTQEDSNDVAIVLTREQAIYMLTLMRNVRNQVTQAHARAIDAKEDAQAAVIQEDINRVNGILNEITDSL